jgi:hypothetical protein
MKGRGFERPARETLECVSHLDPVSLCAYLADLNRWFEEFTEEYAALRRSVCNLENKAFESTGDPMVRFGHCSAPGSGDPVSDPPPTPPTWL